MEKTEFKVGEEFQCGLVKLKCVEAIDNETCIGCIFFKDDCSHIVLGDCDRYHRYDGTDVIFVKVKD